MSDGDRRPLASRDTGWARALARRVAATSITPNQISIAAMGFAALAGIGFWAAGGATGLGRAALLLLAAAGCQLRLICNLIDGMVAVEGGKGGPDGAFWNEAPDRVSDILVLVGMGLGVGIPALGWSAACLAVLTAYLREEGRSLGLAADYSGPMAKPQRMAVATGVAVLSLAEPLWGGQGEVQLFGLWIILIGAGWTCLRRARRILAGLNAR
ncbi:CDP-alcohol phosphatidyltransferase family protein [Tabrizicola sp. J26]|uniref:CDP-alcohol phosphatidyltransferase family protein n=1 Tax=Alitabrizicola rongguiensis TaxID=2909234 RepID=UPI001F321607|nr:CDP-alcohol phosphatidyltransferase family protein [Tabrizicola rongguiensis]MCF1710856.1 CDP-alcohol phosphatidyltransferase family protein [Tabrizicola rongguiensis]